MKRIITYISILAAALIAGVSCSRETSIDEGQDSKLTLVFKTAEMSTRVSVVDGTPVTGVGAENTVDHIDYFFFSDENPESEAIVSGRAVVGTGAGKLNKVSDTEYKYDGFDTSLSDYAALKGPSYLYVLVNYPETVNVKTMNEILALPISTDLTAENALFVMDSFENSGNESGLIYLAPKANAEVREQVVKVSRVAAKMVLNFTVAKEYIDGTKDKWTPVLNQMWWNFLYARKTGAFVNAAPQAFDTKDNYYNTAPDVAPIALNGGALNADNKYEYTTDPVYTYPQSYKTSDVTAPYYKLFLPWVSQKKGQNNFYYKIILPNLPMEGGEKGVNYFQRNKIYQLKVDVSVIGGTEDDWALFSDYIFVADWYSPGEIATSVESARYLDVPVKKYTIYGINEITVPVVSSNDIEIVSVSGSQKTVMGETKNVRSFVINQTPDTGNYCDATGSESFKLHYELDPDITTTTNNSFDCTPIEWTVKIHHKATSDEPYLTKEVTVTIVQYPSIYAVLRDGGNSFVNGFYALQTASVTPTPHTENRYSNNTYYRWNNSGTLYADPNNEENPNDLVNGSYGKLNQVTADKGTTMTLVTVTAFSESSDSYTVWSDGTSSGAPATGQKTEFDYIIGDPRVTWDSFWGDFPANQRNLRPYLWGSTGQGNQRTLNMEDWDDVDKIMVTGTQKNIIAPAYMFSSDIGGRPDNNGVRYENAVKRCATYQEAGYPAGRWRLPTEAELYFAYCLQHMGVIPHLFNGGAGYHASSGNVFDWTDNRNNSGDRSGLSFLRNDWVSQQNANNIVHSIRCVYDIWYWGEEPAVTGNDVHTYYPGTLN